MQNATFLQVGGKRFKIAEKSSSRVFPSLAWWAHAVTRTLKFSFQPALKIAILEAKILNFFSKKLKSKFLPNFFQTKMFSYLLIRSRLSNTIFSCSKLNQKFRQQAEPAKTIPTLGHMRARHRMANMNNAYFFSAIATFYFFCYSVANR